MKVVHWPGESLTVWLGTVPLMRYVYCGDPESTESPKPYVHPLRTLAGDVVTAYRPHDHRWHKGLQMTASHVSGSNFWGGPTWVPERAEYVQMVNNGTIRHDTFDTVGIIHTDSGREFRLDEWLSWVNSGGEVLAVEQRQITASRVDARFGSWELGWTTSLTGLRDEPLMFGSPGTLGRPLAGYSGLFWRGPRAFAGGQILGPDGLGGADLMGLHTAWLAYVGTHDEVDRASTLVFVPSPVAEEPRTHWFVRNFPFPAVNPSWAFHREFALEQGQTITRRYRIIIADCAWDRQRIGVYLRSLPS